VNRPVLAIVTGTHDYQMRLLRSMAEVFDEHGIPLIAHTGGMLRRDTLSPVLERMIRSTSPLGVISSGALGVEEERGLIELLSSLDRPVVTIGFTMPGATAVNGDNSTGMRELMALLTEHRGVRRPVLVRGIPHQPDSIARERVFREELARRGLRVDEDLVLDGGFDLEESFDVTRALLRRRRDFDAVVALNDPSAFGALAALTEAGLQVPEDVALAGYDNSAEARFWPGLTTVDQDLDQQGRAAAELLLEKVAGQDDQADVVVDSWLAVRRSTARDDDPLPGPAEVMEMLVTGTERLAVHESIMARSRPLTVCRTMDDLVPSLTTDLDRTGVSRCFLTLFEHTGPPGDPSTAGSAPSWGRLVLSYHGRGRVEHSDERYDTAQLLPERLQEELTRGLLLLQPLVMPDRTLGFLLLDPAPGQAMATQAIRVDLSRVLTRLLIQQELEARALDLEGMVIRRAQELQAEMLQRQRTEENLQRANTDLQRALRLDGLTGIANRAAFAGHLQQAWRQAATDGASLAVLMIDVDHFKAYNDHYGHVRGDAVLRAVAQHLQEAVPARDGLACRYGGEEFTVILPGSGAERAVAVAERFRSRLAEAALPHAASPVGPLITVSVGIATAHPDSARSARALTEAADRALYEAKALGRNRIVVYEDDLLDPWDPAAQGPGRR